MFYIIRDQLVASSLIGTQYLKPKRVFMTFSLLYTLEASFRQDPMMENICEILYDYSENKLSCYITYVKNQMYQTRTLSKLM